VTPYARVVVFCGVIALAVPSSTATPQQRAPPSALEKYVVTNVRPDAHERQTLMPGGSRRSSAERGDRP
jgi:hypothetical protein